MIGPGIDAISDLLGSCAQDAQMQEMFAAACHDGAAQHVSYGMGWAGAVAMPVLGTLPEAYVAHYLVSGIGFTDPVLVALEEVPSVVAFPGNVPLGLFQNVHKDLEQRFGVAPPSTGRAMVGAFGSIAGMLFYGNTDPAAVDWDGMPSEALIERRGKIALRVHAAVMQRAPDDWPKPVLGPQELSCLHLGARGMCSEEIAAVLQLSERTVIDHFTSARAKIGGKNRIGTVARAVALGLIRPRSLPAREAAKT